MQVLRCRDEDARRTVWSTGIRAGLQPCVVIPGRCVMLMWHIPLNRDMTGISSLVADAW